MVIMRPDSPLHKVRSKIEMDWDINDTVVPRILDASQFDDFQDWADGHCRFVYAPLNEDAKKHASGWAMRNTNNHNVNILKKSCLGVLVCSARCHLPNGKQIHLRPAICDKARRKQQGKTCPNRSCSGRLEILTCRGHCGYPVTHFWRHTDHGVFFQAKGVHDHPQPEAKGSNETRKSLCGPKKSRSLAVLLARDAALNTKLMTLKYPKKSSASALKRKERSPEMTNFNECSSWTANQPHHQTTTNYPPQIHDYHPQQFVAPQQHYSPEYYSPAAIFEMKTIKSPLSCSGPSSGGLEQLSPPLPLANQQMESCNWSSPANHETVKAAPLPTTYDENNNNHQWTEFTFVDAISPSKGEQQPCHSNGGANTTTELSGLPEFVNYCEYDQPTGFPPSISSTASTLSSPTTSTDYNFNYHFDTFNSSMSNDGFEAAVTTTTYQPQLMENYGPYEVTTLPLDQTMYSTESGYQTDPQWPTTTTDISSIPYEPNYYPFVGVGVEKMIY